MNTFLFNRTQYTQQIQEPVFYERVKIVPVYENKLNTWSLAQKVCALIFFLFIFLSFLTKIFHQSFLNKLSALTTIFSNILHIIDFFSRFFVR